MPPGEYFPSFDLRGLSTIAELEWATGGMDVTGGKEVEINIFSRDRLEDVKVMLKSRMYVFLWNTTVCL